MNENNLFNYRFALIFLAGGKGTRLQSTIPKQFLPLNGKIIALHSLETLISLNIFDPIVVVAHRDYHHFFQSFSNLIFAPPGVERQDSLFSGFSKINNKTDFVITHDAARPFVKKEDILSLLNASHHYNAATLATKATDTIKLVNPDLLVEKTLQRKELFHIQTPQLLSYEILQKGLNKVKLDHLNLTDDVSLAEILEEKVKIIEGSPSNIKITYSDDLK